MRKLVIVPKLHSETGNLFLSPHHNDLFDLMEKEIGFEFIKADHIEIPDDVKIIFIFKSPQHSNQNTLMSLAELDRKVKLVACFSDLQDYGKSSYLENMEKILDRADIILTCYWGPFKKKWEKYLYKAKHFPYFFSPYKRYCSLPFNESPIKKCLITGAQDAEVYPLRYMIWMNRGQMIDGLEHPGYRRKISDIIDNPNFALGDNYAKKINAYLMGVATSSIFEYVVGKYFEIPATGSLLLCNEVPDLKLLGFKPNEHYIPITKENALDTIKNVIKNSEAYTKIRRQGMTFVRENHSVKNRIQQIKKIIDEKLT